MVGLVGLVGGSLSFSGHSLPAVSLSLANTRHHSPSPVLCQALRVNGPLGQSGPPFSLTVHHSRQGKTGPKD